MTLQLEMILGRYLRCKRHIMHRENHHHFLRRYLIIIFMIYLCSHFFMTIIILICISESFTPVGLHIGERMLLKRMRLPQHLHLKIFCQEMDLLCFMYAIKRNKYNKILSIIYKIIFLMMWWSLTYRWLMAEPILDFIVVQMLARNLITKLILHLMIMWATSFSTRLLFLYTHS